MEKLKQPLKLISDRVWRTYQGGKMLDMWKGENTAEDSDFPEEWIASFVKARNPGREHIEEGMSKVRFNAKLETLYAHIASEPYAFLGKAHVDTYGNDLGILVKILDAAERLTIQVHPNKAKAKQLFDSAYGKTEAWYILDARKTTDNPPFVFLGFKSGITKEIWRKMFQEQNITAMLDSLHKIPVCSGDVFLVEGGVPHAIGAGCFLMEIQEPTDYTIRVERNTQSGVKIADRLCHQGIGFDAMFDCFSYDGYSKDDVISKYRLCSGKDTMPDVRETLIRYDHTPCFSLNRYRITNRGTIEQGQAFSVIVVANGTGILSGENGKISIAQGDCIFLPACLHEVVCENIGSATLEILQCLPPKS